jgi:hypothetical protein
MKKIGPLVSPSDVERVILSVRGQRVMLDRDLAVLYGVPVGVLNQSVTRNLDRFPPDFMFRLTPEEHRSLRSQFVILEKGRGRHRKYPPSAFTEQGIAMLSGVLRSPRAVAVNIEIMRVFVRLRHFLATHSELARQLAELERRHEAKFKVVFDAIRQIMTPPDPKRRPIGFRTQD